MTVIFSEHKFINEDGKEFKHPGYISKNCVICGKPFPVAIPTADRYLTCGRKSCNKKLQDGGY